MRLISINVWVGFCLYMYMFFLTASCLACLLRWLPRGHVINFQAALTAFSVCRAVAMFFAWIQYGFGHHYHFFATATFMVVSAAGTAIFFIAKTYLLLMWSMLVAGTGEMSRQRMLGGVTFCALFSGLLMVFACLSAAALGSSIDEGATASFNRSLLGLMCTSFVGSVVNTIAFGWCGFQIVRTMEERLWQTMFSKSAVRRATRPLAVVAVVTWLSFVCRAAFDSLAIWATATNHPQYLAAPTALGATPLDIPSGVLSEILPTTLIEIGLLVNARRQANIAEQSGSHRGSLLSSRDGSRADQNDKHDNVPKIAKGTRVTDASVV